MLTECETFIADRTAELITETSFNGIWSSYGLGQEDFCQRLAECEYNVLHPRDSGEIEVFSYGRHQR